MKQLMEFVEKAFEGRARKFTGEPYYNHCVAVALTAGTWGSPGCAEIGLCHALFEDTKESYLSLELVLEDMGYEFEIRNFILNGVAELTTPSNGFNKFTAFDLECIRLARMRSEYQTVKYADILHNVTGLPVDNDPWIISYLAKKEKQILTMRNGDPMLYMLVCHAIVEKQNKIIHGK